MSNKSNRRSPPSHSSSSAADKLDVDQSSIKEQERLLPIANISRIMKRALPDHAKMSKEAKGAVQECVTEFICFVTADSSDRVHEDKRKTIAGDDVIHSMAALGFDSYMAFLDLYLKKYRATQKGNAKEKGGKRKKAGEKGGGSGGGGDDGDDDDDNDGGSDQEEDEDDDEEEENQHQHNKSLKKKQRPE